MRREEEEEDKEQERRRMKPAASKKSTHHSIDVTATISAVIAQCVSASFMNIQQSHTNKGKWARLFWNNREINEVSNGNGLNKNCRIVLRDPVH